MASKESTLPTTPDGAVHEIIYDRFTPGQKRWIVFVVSLASVLPMFVSATFVPSIPRIAKDFDSTHTAVSLSISLSIFAAAVGTLVWAAYSSFYGRRLMYLCGMPLLCIGSCGVAISTSLWTLLFWRFVQTFGCSGGISLGAGVIGDIYKLEERGTGIGIFFGVRDDCSATLLGFAVAPFLGVGAPVAGRLSDIVVRKWRVRRKGVWYPEDRLRTTWIGGLLIVPISIATSGLLTTYLGGPTGLSLNLLCLFMNGMGVLFVTSPIASYNVDVAHSRSAEITAAYTASRSLILSAGAALVIPSIERIGVAWTYIIVAILALVGQG
ncbi:MFS general substrate transporter [Rhizopogon vinicolor AM-OR11-026]|uniref:MFS general substrate transporter n=1 Tax=Rhizopogon vinicolor AM-OR11-026 TaxID=1314800 RepID=A0A1B7MM40_9AGAM|nr:MFS general substrate transporter [Rhizopogon vinicolor AM-OR11-026]